jgi:trehalose 6-phosphate phosphatase
MLLLDFDGTLAPIVDDPGAARAPERTLRLLESLAASPQVTIAVISGRALSDLRPRLVSGLILAGNHGLEIEGHGIRFREPVAESLHGALAEVAARLQYLLGAIRGMRVEDKGLSLSVHYRKAAPQDVSGLGAIVRDALAGLDDRFVMCHAKAVIEVRPRVSWNKGSAAAFVRDQKQLAAALPVCVGDDTTDEDLFRALPDGISVRVGAWSEKSYAGYQVDDPDQAFEFLSLVEASLGARE